MQRVFAKISLIESSDGGRSEPIPIINFGCPAFFDAEPLMGHGYDCRLLLKEYGKELIPGRVFNKVPMAFLWEDDVLPYLKIGTKFCLWEGKTIAQCEIQEME